MQRSAKKQMLETGIGTKSQQALKLQQEQNKQERKEKNERKKKSIRDIKSPLSFFSNSGFGGINNEEM